MCRLGVQGVAEDGIIPVSIPSTPNVEIDAQLSHIAPPHAAPKDQAGGKVGTVLLGQLQLSFPCLILSYRASCFCAMSSRCRL